MKRIGKTFPSNRYKQRICLFRLKMRVLQNRNNGRVNKDIIIPLIVCHDKETFYSYNVSRFLRKHRSKINSRKWIENAKEFIRLLDKKVHVDPSDAKYAHIYQGIDIIVQRLIHKLGNFDPLFERAKLLQTGSISSNIKVGLPHEADYTLEIPHNKTLNDGTKLTGKLFISMARNIVGDYKHELIQGLGRWVIHGTKPHERIGGVCLVMELKQSDSSLVGVTVDIVPVYAVTQTHETFNEKACLFLPHSLSEYTQRRKLYRLIDQYTCDTGLIENMIIKELPDDQKHAFRAVKFLCQNRIVLPSNSFYSFDIIPNINEEMLLKLYGYKPAIPSYKLRVHFLHLLLHVQGTDAAQHLKGGVLAACLLDMLKQCDTIEWEDGVGDMNVQHPLIKNRTEVLNFNTFLRMASDHLKRIADQFESENIAEAVDAINLLSDRRIIDEKYDIQFFVNIITHKLT